MELNLIRIAVTLVSFAAFIAIVWRAWRKANAAAFAEAAALPFADEAPASPGSVR
jgi:cbb3-type cytochrome oxidase subunit 3